MSYLRFLDAEEKFFLLSIGTKKNSAILLRVGRDRKLTCEKVWSDFPLERLSRRWSGILPSWSVIVAVHPALAYTFSVPLDVARDEQLIDREFTAIELENLLGKGVTQNFSMYREEASAALGLTGLETVLADSRVGSFRVDGHRVHNPLGFTPKAVQGVAEMTFVGRSLYAALHGLAQRPNFFFTDTAHAQLFVLSKIHGLPLSLVFLDSPSSVFYMDKTTHGFTVKREELKWSAHSFLDFLAATWSLDEPTARGVYEAYGRRDLSQKLHKFLTQHFKDISRLLELRLSKLPLKGKVFVSGGDMLPFPAVFPKGIKEHAISVTHLLDQMGFSAEVEEWPILPQERFYLLAPFLEYFSDQGSPEINRQLRRRLHWLGSMNYT